MSAAWGLLGVALLVLPSAEAFGRRVQVYVHPRPISAVGIRMQASADEPSFSLEKLSSRIEAMKAQPDPDDARILILDSMVPGQKLRMDVPQSLAETIDRCAESGTPIVMAGRHRLTVHTHGVECVIEERSSPAADGSIDVTIAAVRCAEIIDPGEDEGSRWLGRAGKVRWLSLDPTDAAQPEEGASAAMIARAEALEPLVSDWSELVRGGRERAPGQLDRVMEDIGPMPPAEKPSQRALWVAALINPLPALGVALEVRPAVLMAPTADLRLQVAETGLRDSIQRLQLPGPAF